MTSKNIFLTPRFWFELPQILGLGFSVWTEGYHRNVGCTSAPRSTEHGHKSEPKSSKPTNQRPERKKEGVRQE